MGLFMKIDTNGVKRSSPAEVERILSHKQLADLKMALISRCPFNVVSSAVILEGGLASVPLLLKELDAEEAGETKTAYGSSPQL